MMGTSIYLAIILKLLKANVAAGILNVSIALLVLCRLVVVLYQHVAR